MNKLSRIFLFFGLITFGCNISGSAQVTTHTLVPGGTYKTIDVARHKEAFTTLNNGTPQQKEQTAATVLKNPNYYNPAVIYALSRELFRQDKKDEAAYWFYVGQLRARYDANLCKDVSARQGVAVLNNEYGPEINQYAMKDLDKLTVTVKKVIEFVRNNNEDYDHRWISLHGMGAVMSGFGEKEGTGDVIEPESKWPAIKKKTIDDYWQGFLEASKTLKK
jgi:hypothetical protein